MSRLTDSLALLKRLNEARRIGQHYAASLLTEQLDEHDSAGGWMRTIKPTSDAIQPGKRGRGKQRNPNWRAALDKLNAMRGRTT